MTFPNTAFASVLLAALISAPIVARADIPACPSNVPEATDFLADLTDTEPSGWTNTSGGGVYSLTPLSGVYVGQCDLEGSYAYQCVTKEGTKAFTLNCNSVEGAPQNYSCISQKQ
ncbi:hypothetical protein M3P05_10770 [Sansalvadorimonas sp. 2012CJ34-2]|uniref:Uncharacterized protein n=1 Tax=Parendozoicomonas callyspongiae TaxID=2942213 RepID=A0ABT0PG90_9GAMM|nr:hypothetical protein [Sansalvadorimonas sp. 2012CJ34-2]MCL6270402.1 hypothetical protein [Sansalvadorimonas sp. 2012CJ34-2]